MFKSIKGEGTWRSGSLVVLIAISLIFSSCATRNVVFTSYPVDTEVTAGSAKCTTPCSMSVSDKVETVLFKAENGDQQSILIPSPTDGLVKTKTLVAKIGWWGSETLAVLFSVVGLIGFELAVEVDEDEGFGTTVNDDGARFLLLGVASLAAAVLFKTTSDYIAKQIPSPATVHADFSDFLPSNPDSGIVQEGWVKIGEESVETEDGNE